MTSKALKSTTPLGEAATTLAPYESKPLKAAFLVRGVRALTELADRLEPSELERVLAADTRASTLLLALSQPGAVGLVQSEDDPLARARVRGLARREELLALDGGTLSTEEIAKALHLTPQAVHKRRAAGNLLAFQLGRRGLRFPAWQLASDGTLRGLEEVLEALADAPPLAVARFFLSGNRRLGGKRPLDILKARRSDIAPVIAAARSFDEQGAA